MKLTRQQAALKASSISAQRTIEQKSDAARKAAKTRCYYIDQALRLGVSGPMTFQDAGKKGASIRWGYA
ncbi:MAG: hypothetical protein LLG04_01695 [Parachlamydia sp.]|nr:hypothetical protein [Parachlamydia sp.]